MAFNSARDDFDLQKKVNTCNFSCDFKIGPHLGPKHVMNSSHAKIFLGCEDILRYFSGTKTYYDNLGV